MNHLKTRLLLCCSLLFPCFLSAQSSISKNEAQALVQRYLDDATRGYDDPASLDFFLGDFSPEESGSLEFFYADHYKIDAVNPPWVTVLTTTYQPGEWTQRYHFKLVQQQDSLYIVPKRERYWTYNHVTPYQDITEVAIPFSVADHKRIREQFLADHHVAVEDVSFDRPNLLGDWRIAACISCDALPYRHWAKHIDHISFAANGQLGEEGSWLAYGDSIVLFQPDNSQFEAYEVQQLKDGSLWLSRALDDYLTIGLHLTSGKTSTVDHHSQQLSLNLPNTTVLIPPRYRNLVCFSSDLLRFTENGKDGLMDYTGKIVLPATCDQMGWFDESGNNYCNQGDTALLIDTSGIITARFPFEIVRQNGEGTYVMRKDGEEGIIDSTGKYLVAPEYSRIHFGSKLYYQVVKKDRWGLIDQQGKVILPLEYDGLRTINDTLVILGQKGKYGVMDLVQQKLILPLEFSRINMRSPTVILAYRGDQVEAYRADGSKWGDQNYDFISWIGYQYLGVEKDQKRGVANLSGRIIIPLMFKDITLAGIGHPHYFDVITPDGTAQTIDSVQQVVGPEELERMYQEEEQRFQERMSDMEMDTVTAGLKIKKMGMRYGLTDQTGQLVIPPIYDYADRLPNGKILVQQEAHYGILDEAGNVLAPLIFDELSSCRESNYVKMNYQGKYGLLKLADE